MPISPSGLPYRGIPGTSPDNPYILPDIIKQVGDQETAPDLQSQSGEGNELLSSVREELKHNRRARKRLQGYFKEMQQNPQTLVDKFLPALRSIAAIADLTSSNKARKAAAPAKWAALVEKQKLQQADKLQQRRQVFLDKLGFEDLLGKNRARLLDTVFEHGRFQETKRHNIAVEKNDQARTEAYKKTQAEISQAEKNRVKDAKLFDVASKKIDRGENYWTLPVEEQTALTKGGYSPPPHPSEVMSVTAEEHEKTREKLEKEYDAFNKKSTSSTPYTPEEFQEYLKERQWWVDTQMAIRYPTSPLQSYGNQKYPKDIKGQINIFGTAFD